MHVCMYVWSYNIMFVWSYVIFRLYQYKYTNILETKQHPYIWSLLTPLITLSNQLVIY